MRDSLPRHAAKRLNPKTPLQREPALWASLSRLPTHIPAGRAGWKAGCRQDCLPHEARTPARGAGPAHESLRPQRLDRVDRGGAARGEITRQDGGAEKTGRYHGIGERIDRADFEQKRRHQAHERGRGRETSD